MRSFLIVLGSFMLVLGLSVAVSAHVGPTYYAQQVNPATITIDGLGNDAGWNAPLWDAQNTITTDMLAGSSSGEMQPLDDFDVALKVGWSAPPDNRLYIHALVKDDYLNDESFRCGDAWRDDSMEIVMDADHGGGNFNTIEPRGSTGGQYRCRIGEGDFLPGPGNDETNTIVSHCISDATRWWDSGAPYMEVAVQKPVGRTNITYGWEVKTNMADWLGESDATTQWHTFAQGQTIGLAVTWNDADAEVDTRDSQPGTAGPEGPQYWMDADQIQDFILIPGPTAVEAASWGAIKATFQR